MIQGKETISAVQHQPGFIHAITEDGMNHLVPVADWEAAGNTIPSYVPPPVPAPMPLTARQLRLGLVLNGFGLEQVASTINAIEDEQDRAVAKIEWEWASSFERKHPLVEQIGGALGLSEEQIDAMWAEAMTL